MKHSDIDAIARQADPSYAGNQQSPFDSSCLPMFAALLLKKLVSEIASTGIPSISVDADDHVADWLMQMSAALQSGDSSGGVK